MTENFKTLFKKWNERPFSWSQMSSFEYDPEQWYKNYFLGERGATTAEMEFGKKIAQSIEDGTCDIPGLLEILQKKKEHPFRVMFGKIVLVGYADAFCDQKFRDLDEVKTGKKAWDQKRADQHGQIDMYLLMNYVTNKVRPEEVRCRLHWIPTQDNGDFSISFVKPVRVRTFETRRTMQEILAFGQRINRVRKEMEKYAKNHS